MLSFVTFHNMSRSHVNDTRFYKLEIYFPITIFPKSKHTGNDENIQRVSRSFTGANGAYSGRYFKTFFLIKFLSNVNNYGVLYICKNLSVGTEFNVDCAGFYVVLCISIQLTIFRCRVNN